MHNKRPLYIKLKEVNTELSSGGEELQTRRKSINTSYIFALIERFIDN